MVASVTWHHEVCVEGTKEKSHHSSPREAAVPTKDIFSLFYLFFFPCVFQEKHFHLQAFAVGMPNQKQGPALRSGSTPSAHAGL